MTKREKNKLTKLWGQAIHKLYNETCAVCGKRDGSMQAHHIYTRRRMTTRFDINNGILLCYSCHKGSSILSAHEAPEAFFNWLKKTKGEDWLKKLRRKSEQTTKQYPIDYNNLLEKLKNI